MKRCYKLIALLGFLAVTTAQAQNVFTYQVGNFEVSLLSEGQQTANTSILLDAPQDIINRYTENGNFPNAINAFVVRTPDKIILIDAGLGRLLFDNLKSLNIAPEQVNVVLLTHMHGDHIGGLIRDGKAAFPNAEIYLSKPEYNYWKSNKQMKRLPENRRSGFEQARNVLKVYKKKLRRFKPIKFNGKPTELISGIQAIAAYGHTPGHTIYLLSSDNQKLLVWGDLTHAMAVQMPCPEIAVSYDIDPKLAIKSRQEVLKYVADNIIPVAGMHIAFPAIGKLYDGFIEGYKFCPAIDHKAVTKAIEEQLQAFPKSHLQDIYKSFFQDYFGPGHLIPDTAAAGNYLRRELAGYDTPSGTLVEPTGWQSNFYRVNLSVLKENKIPYEVFMDAFTRSANNITIPSAKEWFEAWREIQTIIDKMQLDLPNYEEEKVAIMELLLSGKYAVHHSKEYGQSYQPHYRIIEKTIFEQELKKYLE